VTRTGGIAAVAVAIATYGLAFGVLAHDAGLGVTAVLAMSALAYSGGAQAAFVASLVAEGPAAALTAAILVNLRLGLYGVMANRVLAHRSLPVRLAGVHLATDETIALTSAAAPDARTWTYWTSGLVFFLAWTVSTSTGAVIGHGITDPTTVGLDVAFPAVFMALLFPMLRHRRTLTVAVLAAVTTALSTPVVPSGLPVLIAMAAACAYLILRRATKGGAP
jgi:predicted branched-subunit amino acid permease